jgi:hypothetical protein
MSFLHELYNYILCQMHKNGVIILEMGYKESEKQPRKGKRHLEKKRTRTTPDREKELRRK